MPFQNSSPLYPHLIFIILDPHHNHHLSLTFILDCFYSSSVKILVIVIFIFIFLIFFQPVFHHCFNFRLNQTFTWPKQTRWTRWTFTFPISIQQLIFWVNPFNFPCPTITYPWSSYLGSTLIITRTHSHTKHGTILNWFYHSSMFQICSNC